MLMISPGFTYEFHFNHAKKDHVIVSWFFSFSEKLLNKSSSFFNKVDVLSIRKHHEIPLQGNCQLRLQLKLLVIFSQIVPNKGFPLIKGNVVGF